MKTEIKHEFKIIEQNGTLVLDKPAQVTFLNSGGAGSVVTINQALILNSVVDFQAGAPFNPYQFTFTMNNGEIDTTDYQVTFSGAGTKRLLVILKYFINQK